MNVQFICLDQPKLQTYAIGYTPLPANPSAILEFPDASLDLVVVDDWYRPVCARAVFSNLKPGAFFSSTTPIGAIPAPLRLLRLAIGALQLQCVD